MRVRLPTGRIGGMNHAVILAGGVGTRLWPVSRQKQPKQFQKLTGDKTLVQDTFERLLLVVEASNVWVITNEAYRDLVIEQLPNLAKENILVEPVGRNTAPAIGLAAIHIVRRDPEAKIGSFAADHFVGKPAAFARATKAGFELINTKPEYLVAIGLNPTEPDTSLGYIKMGDELGKFAGEPVFIGEKFIEKPDLKTAQQFVKSWEYLWNGCYFLFDGRQMGEWLENFAPNIYSGLNSYLAKPSLEKYQAIPSVPIDTAIAEKVEHLAVVPADMDWSDVGSWSTLDKVLAGNGMQATTNHTAINTENTLVISHTDKMIATVGIKDVVIVDTPDAILICHKDEVQNVKLMVDQLHQEEKTEYL